jgi:PTH1 family peptidyl-tRNA hydrolase
MEKLTYIIAGLGNPGRQYRNTRHNAGFIMIDHLVEEYKIRLSKMQFNAITGSIELDSARVILAKPQTFMNLSGQSVAALVRFYKIPLEQLLVAHDDIDLPVGALRIRPGGGAGGQKGLASTIERLGTQEFPRMRIGIGRPSGTQEAAGYVLQEFSTGDIRVLKAVFPQAVQAVHTFITEGLQAAMNRYNGLIGQE